MKHLAILMPLLISSCAYHSNYAISPLGVSGAKEAPVAIKTGRSASVTILGFIGPIGDHSLESALADAKEGTDADTMQNVFVDSTFISFPAPFLPLLVVRRTVAHGTLVKYVDESGKRLIEKRPQETRAEEIETRVAFDEVTTPTRAKLTPIGIDQARKFFQELGIGDRVVITQSNGTKSFGTYHGLREPDRRAAWIDVKSNGLERTTIVYLDRIAEVRKD